MRERWSAAPLPVGFRPQPPRISGALRRIISGEKFAVGDAVNPLHPIKHLGRYRQIGMVFVKHGFGGVLDQLGILKYLQLPRRAPETAHARLSWGERLRLALEELGPAFIKLGQIASTRPELLPADVILELEKLRDEVPAIPGEAIRRVIEQELGAGVAALFAEFCEEPLAAASIAQVHRARLRDGAAVVVKVQRPGIERIIEHDLNILEDLAGFLDHRTKWGRIYDFGGMVAEFGRALRNELDFRVEAANADRLRENLRRESWVRVPAIHWNLTARRVLTMEFIAGVPLSPAALRAQGLDRTLLARRLAATWLNQILRDGFFHADPHSGNILALPGNAVALLDLGMVGRLSGDRQSQLLKVLIGLIFDNNRLIVQALIDLGVVNDQPVNLRRLERAVGRVREKYLTLTVRQIRIGEIFRELFGLASSFQLMVPEEFAVLGKTLMLLEGLVASLDPDLSVLEIATPITKRLLLGKLAPANLKQLALKELIDYGLLASRLPSFLMNLLVKMEERDFALSIRVADWERIIDRLTRLFNRIAFSIILLALSIIVAGVIIGSGIGGLVAELGNAHILRLESLLAVIIMAGLVIYLIRSGRI
jgi:ubiquinone biosynthesis protein